VRRGGAGIGAVRGRHGPAVTLTPVPLPNPLRRRKSPKLTVVIPVYNVRRYLSETLDSVLRQPVDDIEVIVVDDGSTDGSAEVAEDYVRRDRRFRLVRQENAGVSTARNIAVPMASGEFLTFVDGDDELPADAWTTMMRTLEKTGSDFVVGNMERLAGDRRFVTPLMRRNHREERLGVTLEQMPLMLADVFSVNKIYRLDFWREAKIWFPERTRYQDQPALTQAFLAARAFDVLTETVYQWRVREDRSSATQQRAQLSNLKERVETKRMTIDMVREKASTKVQHVLFSEILPIDMWEYFRAVPGASEEYWSVLRDAVREFWNSETVPFEETTVPVQRRLMGWLVSQGRREDLERLIHLIDTEGVVVTDGELQHPWREEPGLPKGVTVAG
jgi:glycosyltransferase involved in cell wall biosynthesis